MWFRRLRAFSQIGAGIASPTRLYIRLGGISGASAVALGAYGAHVLPQDDYRIEIFEKANKYHFFHSLGLLMATQASKPHLVGAGFTFGMLLFCGSLYYTAIKDDRALVKVAPIGGTALILAWLAFIL